MSPLASRLRCTRHSRRRGRCTHLQSPMFLSCRKFARRCRSIGLRLACRCPRMRRSHKPDSCKLWPLPKFRPRRTSEHRCLSNESLPKHTSPRTSRSCRWRCHTKLRRSRRHWGCTFERRYLRNIECFPASTHRSTSRSRRLGSYKRTPRPRSHPHHTSERRLHLRSTECSPANTNRRTRR